MKFDEKTVPATVRIEPLPYKYVRVNNTLLDGVHMLHTEADGSQNTLWACNSAWVPFEVANKLSVDNGNKKAMVRIVETRTEATACKAQGIVEEVDDAADKVEKAEEVVQVDEVDEVPAKTDEVTEPVVAKKKPGRPKKT